MSMHHSSKFAVEGFSESVSYESASQNIQVKLIEPGAIHTDFGGRSMEFFYASPPEIVAETIYQNLHYELIEMF
ncbi:SDR family NAD(P)-dependent oxidoreductase [Paenibacillus silagei]|uniref:SDR family NAD(P)-dependent oxidoreductase n=1 Tax=Paenibacillus silagei TaxID=1670801 RepID=UPI00247A3B91|nr:SDR family NAD(P)-dependent oxidoreductase [Paenibacillus silagei]